MSEPWVEKIIQDIKEKDRDSAEKIMHEEHQRKVISEKAPIFWQDFADFLQEFIKEIQTGLSGHITEGIFSFALNANSHTITFGKSAFPFISFTATPELNSGKVTMHLTKVNPSLVGSASGSTIPCRFEVQRDGTLVLQLNDHSYAEPAHAAKFIIEKAFTI
jgi:hypothetical protein